MEIVVIIVFILVAVIVLVDLLLTPWAKNEYKGDAYSILKKGRGDAKEISQTIKGLNSTMGFIFKDEESKILFVRLIDKLERSKD